MTLAFVGGVNETSAPIAAAGGHLEVEHIHIWRIAGGRLAEHWMVRDDLTAIRQLSAAAPRDRACEHYRQRPLPAPSEPAHGHPR